MAIITCCRAQKWNYFGILVAELRLINNIRESFVTGFIKKYGWLVALFMSGSLLTAGHTDIDSLVVDRPLSLFEMTESSVRMSYRSEPVSFEQVVFLKDSFYRISLPYHGYESEPGMPALPVYTTLFDLSGKEVESISIRNVTYNRVYPSSMGIEGLLVPALEPGTKGYPDQDDVRTIDQEPYINNDYYLRTGPYISDTVSVSVIGTLRGNKIGNLRINPVIYYPSDNFIDVITGMDIEINFRMSEESGPVTGSLKSASTTSLLAKGIINYNPDDVIAGFSLEPVGLIIVADTVMKRHLKPLVEWKRRKGFRVSEIYIGENGITKDFTSIKNAIAEIYDGGTEENPAPEYLILAGDLNYIPASEGTTWLSDMYYAEFDGSGDWLPDMFTGRLPARDTSQMKNIVNKILQYERFEFGDTIDHYKSALAFTGYDLSNITIMNGQVNYGAGYLDKKNGIDAHIMTHNTNDSIRSVRYDSVLFLLNEGLGFINYTGHGDTYGWLHTGINYNTIATLKNKSRYPVIVSNACQTANYANINSFGSTFVRQKEKGALAFIGCSNDSYWTEDFYFAVGVSQLVENPQYEDSGAGFYDRWFHLNNENPGFWHISLGQLLFSGNMAVSESTSSKKKYYWETYTLLGDPSIIPFIGTPTPFSETLPDSIPRALNRITFETDPFAYVAISHRSTLWDASHASPSGVVMLDIPEGTKDSCQVVITGQNKIPFVKTIYFFDPDTAWMSINDINTDDLNGNNNGLADYSETISLSVELQNAGGGDSPGTYLILSSNSEYLEILSDSVYLGNITALTEQTLDNLFEIRIDDNIPDLEIVSLYLSLKNGSSTEEQLFDLSLHSPDPVILSCYADDSESGNGNNLAEAGEKVSIIVRVSNRGSSTTSGVLFFSSSSEYIDFSATSVNSGTIEPGETVELSVDATISEETPEATSIEFTAFLDCYPYSDTRNLSIFAGKSTEDFETQNFTTFPWKNNLSYPWIISENESYSNSFSARSGLSSSNHSQESVLSLYINMPEDDTLSFWYKVSSEYNYDWFRFQVDSIEIFRESGLKDWEIAKIPLSGGVHQLQWIYAKDLSLSEGLDCVWIDFLRFPEIAFLKNDISLNRILSPKPFVQYMNEPVTVELTNLGRDTLTKVELAYVLNDDTPVFQTFLKNINPGDTVNLTFSERVDLSEPGNYFIDLFPAYADEYSKNDTIRGTFISYNYLIQVGPNPFDDRISFTSQGQYDDITVKLFSSKGIPILEKWYEQFQPGQIVTLEIPYLAGGLYILKINTRHGTKTYKLVKR
jgi:hypothetical protein